MDEIKETEVQGMTDTQAKMLIESIKIIAEKSETKEEFPKELDRIQNISPKQK